MNMQRVVQSVDPFIDLIRLLRPQATLWRRIDGMGRWGVSFRKRDDLLFCSVAQGECQLARPSMKPLQLRTGDFVLVKTSTPFTLTSDPKLSPEDSEKAFRIAGSDVLKLGSGRKFPVTLHGGRFLFDTANEDLLTSLLPPLIHIAADATSAERIQLLLQMNASEAAARKPGSAFVIERLMELLLIDILRDQSMRTDGRQPGMLAGLADPVVAAALHAMHRDVAHGWTVAELARQAGVSRSKFAAHFQAVVGVGPIQYLLDWRMALARDELRQGTRALSEIAFAIGFQSVSAFSTAFRRTVGLPPSHYAGSLHQTSGRH